MKVNFTILILIMLNVNCISQNILNPYPINQNIVTDNYFNNNYSDPFRFFENISDSTVLNWMHSQNNFSYNILGQISKRQELINKREKRINNKIKTSLLSITSNDRYFYLKTDTIDNNFRLFVRYGITGVEKLLFDPKLEHPNAQSNYIINYIGPNKSGSKVVVALTKNDEEVGHMLVIDVETKKILSELIENCWPASIAGISWLPNDSSFIYTHIPNSDRNSPNFIQNTEAVIFTLGTDSKQLNVIFSKKNNPELEIKSEDFAMVFCPTDNNKILVARRGGATYNKDYYYANLDKQLKWIPLFKAEDKIRDINIIGDEIYYITSKNAPNLKICKTEISNPNFDSPTVLIEESDSEVISDYIVTDKGLFIVKTINGIEANLYHLINGETRKIEIPKKSGRINLSYSAYKTNKFWINIRGWTHANERYKYDISKNTFLSEELVPISNYPELDNTIIEEIEVESHDGVKVPLSLIYDKSMKLNGQNRLLLYGYGSFGLSREPMLSQYLYEWVAAGGIFAVAHVRGGGEKGEAWHKGGLKATKPNTWKDFIACSEFLIDYKYTAPKYFSVFGSSAGGILVGRAVTERPDLYAAAIIKGGILNTMRTEFGANGKNIAKELGTIEDSIEIGYLYEMDSYHHVQNTLQYPAIYLAAGYNDSRVPIWHSSKFAAKLLQSDTNKNLVLYSIDFGSGHGVNATISEKLESVINILSFALWQTGHPDFQPLD